MNKSYIILGGVAILFLLFLILRCRSFLVAPNVGPAYNLISVAGEKQTKIDELTKQHIIKVQTLKDPNAITTENAEYAAALKKIEEDYMKKI